MENKTLEKIHELIDQSFEGWSDDSVNGYLTALKTIEKFIESHPSTNQEIQAVQFDMLQEGDYVENLSESEFGTLIDLENDSCRLYYIEGLGLAMYNGILVTDNYQSARLKTKLTPSEFLRRAENTFKTR